MYCPDTGIGLKFTETRLVSRYITVLIKTNRIGWGIEGGHSDSLSAGKAIAVVQIRDRRRCTGSREVCRSGR